MSTKLIRENAAAVLRRFAVTQPPVPVERLANELGFRVVFQDLGPNVSGILVNTSGISCIAVQEADSPRRQRFTIAHELGHHLLGHQFAHDGQVHVDYGNFISRRSARTATDPDPKEIAANQFAADLLMPSTMVCEEAARITTTSLHDHHVSRLADLFDVSEQAMAIRLTKLGLL